MALSEDSAARNRNGENQIGVRSGPRRRIELLSAGVGGDTQGSLGWGEGGQVRTHFLNMAHGLLFSSPCSARTRRTRRQRGKGDLERSRGGDGRCRAVVLESVLQEDTAPRPSSSVCGPSFFLGVWAGL